MRLVPKLSILVIVPLAMACDPGAMADKAVARAAESVVLPVVSHDLPGPVAQAATRCIIDGSDAAERQMLARDVGVEAGTQTKANIRALARKPAVQACFAANGVPPVTGGQP